MNLSERDLQKSVNWAEGGLAEALMAEVAEPRPGESAAAVAVVAAEVFGVAGLLDPRLSEVDPADPRLSWRFEAAEAVTLRKKNLGAGSAAGSCTTALLPQP